MPYQEKCGQEISIFPANPEAVHGLAGGGGRGKGVGVGVGRGGEVG